MADISKLKHLTLLNPVERVIEMETYFENPGVPTEAERGTYCPHGVLVMGPVSANVLMVADPWPCNRPGCTRAKFEEVLAEVEAELAEADRHAAGCMLGPGHKEPCDGDRGNLSH